MYILVKKRINTDIKNSNRASDNSWEHDFTIEKFKIACLHLLKALEILCTHVLIPMFIIFSVVQVATSRPFLWLSGIGSGFPSSFLFFVFFFFSQKPALLFFCLLIRDVEYELFYTYQLDVDMRIYTRSYFLYEVRTFSFAISFSLVHFM